MSHCTSAIGISNSDVRPLITAHNNIFELILPLVFYSPFHLLPCLLRKPLRPPPLPPAPTKECKLQVKPTCGMLSYCHPLPQGQWVCKPTPMMHHPLTWLLQSTCWPKVCPLWKSPSHGLKSVNQMSLTDPTSINSNLSWSNVLLTSEIILMCFLLTVPKIPLHCPT